MTSRSPGEMDVLHSCLDDLTAFLQSYIPLANRNTIDFFLEDLWTSSIPIRIRNEVMSVPESSRLSLGSFPLQKDTEIQISDFEDTENEGLELEWKHNSLLEYLTETRRVYQSSIGPSVVSDLISVYEELGCAETLGEVVSVKHMISPKKIHEVEVMAELCARIADGLRVSAIVDLGSGKGYLGTTLAYAFHQTVLGIDCSETNTTGALIRNQKIDKKWNNLLKKRGATEHRKINYKASTEYVTARTDFKSMIRDHFPDSCVGESCLLTGLHTCGNLAAYSLRIFVDNEDVRGVCNVGCCYEHLTQRGEVTAAGDRPAPGFPMSEYLREKNVSLVKQVRSLASQPLARIADGTLRPSKSLFWRAILQVILTDQNGGQSRDTWMVGKAGNKCQNFVSYCRKALEKLNKHELSEQLSDEYLLEYESRYLPRESTIYAFYQLRIVLSPLIEATILLDRLAYLRQQAAVEKAYLIRLFDPVTSPRCYSLVAWKRQNDHQKPVEQ